MFHTIRERLKDGFAVQIEEENNPKSPRATRPIEDKVIMKEAVIAINPEMYRELTGEFLNLSEQPHVYTIFRANGQPVASYLSFQEAYSAVTEEAGEIVLQHTLGTDTWAGYDVNKTRYAIICTPLLSKDAE